MKFYTEKLPFPCKPNVKSNLIGLAMINHVTYAEKINTTGSIGGLHRPFWGLLPV